MAFEIGRITRLELGYVGEGDSREIVIDMSQWRERWPDAIFGIVAKRPKETELYIAATETEGDTLSWEITAADVEVEGKGFAQIRAVNPMNGECYMSRVVETKIDWSLGGSDGAVVPEASQNWVNQVLLAAQRAEAAADRAENAGGGGGSSSGGGAATAIPSYVREEAMDVLDRVIAVQGSRTFTLMAITDMHYGSSDYTEGVQHAAQAMKYIADRIKIDAVAVLGDYTDEHQMDTDTAVHDLEECNALLDPLREQPNLRMKGNHDHRPGEDAEIYRYIMAYSEDVVWGSRLGGYFYRDFEAYKLRVVCLNTTEVARSNLSVSEKQYSFFVDAMDLSGKEKPGEWGILILSHHPVDFTVTDGNYRFGHIINAYMTGSRWTDGVITCDFTGNNDAALIGNIHGHLHNLLVDKIYLDAPGSSAQTSVNRMCTPASRVDYVNHYAPPWQEAKWYEKTPYTAEDTSFCVYCIDLNAKQVNAICYGAGYDRVMAWTGGSSTEGEDNPSSPVVENWLPYATDTDGSIYNAKGWKANARYSASSDAESEYEGIYLTGYIPVAQGDVVRLKNVGIATDSDSARVNVVIFGSDMSDAWEAANADTLMNRFGAVLGSDGKTVQQFTIPDEGTKYIRFNASYLGEDSVITVNLEI